jgi:hypothetical protein
MDHQQIPLRLLMTVKRLLILRKIPPIMWATEMMMETMFLLSLFPTVLLELRVLSLLIFMQ